MKIRDLFRFSLNTNLFRVIAILVVMGTFADTYVRYQETQKIIEKRVHERARSLHEYFVSMRYVFHQQFLKSGIDLNDSTVGFLPAHAASLISDEFEKKASQKISIRNVSDNPRNPKNKADTDEIAAIEYFRTHPNEKEFSKDIQKDGKKFYFYAAPLKISAYCLACHGIKENTELYIKNRYDSAYDYNVGDIRGVTSIKIEKRAFSDPMMDIFWETTVFGFSVTLILLGIAYGAILKLTKREGQIKIELENTVAARTIELKNAYVHEKHLRSILRTVADVNQLLITTEDIDELAKKSADT